MPESLAATKLAPQHCNEGHIARPHLEARLGEVLGHRVTVVHAGAGYGKTSLLMQWFGLVRRRRTAAVWLTLEEDEATPGACLTHIVVALAQAGYFASDPLPGKSGFDAKMTVKSLATAFINILAESAKPAVIFLDEYNRAASEQLDALFRVLLRNLPANAHVVVASRHRPAFDMEYLRARGDLLELTAPDLCFTVDEVAELLGGSGARIEARDVLRLTQRTEGWPIAVQMARMWLNADGSARFVSDFSGRTSDLARYLAEQVFSAQPQEIQDFLLLTSIVDRISGNLANALTGGRDGWQMLEEAYDRDLFLVPETEDRDWYRYHALFADFLRDRLQRRGADAVAELHRRASEWWSGAGNTRAAVMHALTAGDHAAAARMLSGAGGWRLVMDGRINLIRSGIAHLPETLVREVPSLAMAKAFLLVKDGDVRAARAYFEGLDARAAWTGDDAIDRDVVEHILADYADEPVSGARVEQILALKERIRRSDHVLHAVLTDSLATAHYELGQFRAALDACEDAIGRYRIIGSLYGEVFLRFTQAKSWLAQGRLDEAERILRSTEKELELRFGEGIELAAHTSIYVAEILLERDAVAEATRRLQDAVPVIEHSDGWYELYAASGSAAIALAWREYGLDACLDACERMRELSRTRGLERLLLLADCLTVHYLYIEGRGDRCREYSDRLESALETLAGRACNRRPTALVTSVAMTRIAQQRAADAVRLLAEAASGAESCGDVRQLVLLNLVLADAHMNADERALAAAALERSVRLGLFTGMRRQYLELGHPLAELINEVLDDGAALAQDRYRDGFLREIRRDVRRTDRRHHTDAGLPSGGEVAVLRELQRGLSNKEIARRLGISPNTVKYRLKGLFSKMGVNERADLVRVCRERLLIPGDNSRA